MADVKWIKLVSDMFDNRKIKQIRNMPDSDAIIVIWLQILCLAGNTNNNGIVYFSKDIPYTDEMLATEFDRPITTIRMALSIFVKFEMIEIINDFIMISNWEKYQSQAKLESIREYNRDKQREHREKQKLLVESITDGQLHVNDNQDTDIDIEVDIDKEKENKKNIGVFEKFAQDNEALLKTLKDFEIMRKSKGKPLTQRAKELLIKGLIELSTDGEDIIECLNQSILNSWQGVFPVKRGDKNGFNQQPNKPNESTGGWDIKPSVKV